jgi:hypothetical protein
VEGNKFVAGFINLVAQPHPEGVYEEALNAVVNSPVQYFGSNFAAIRPASRNPNDPNMLEGVLTVWTDVSTDEPSIDKATLEEVALDEELKRIFAKRGFNNRSFLYVLDTATHTVAVELLNDHGKTLSPRQAGRIFERAFSRLNREGQTYEVTVIPEDDALSQVLAIRRLDKVRIVIKRPNPGDHLDTDAEEVLREMEEQNINRDERVFTRQSGTDSINLNEANHTRAEVAATDGYVESSGKNEDGEVEQRSTREYPKIVKRTLAAGTGAIAALRAEVRRFRGG